MPDQAARLQRQFGAALRAARKASGLSQSELSLRAKLSLNYVGEIERGRRMITLITLVRLAVALETTPAELLGAAGL